LSGKQTTRVETALTGQAVQLAAHSLTARAEVALDVPQVLLPHGDLDLILTNLVGNAVKYNRDGGNVTVRAKREAQWLRVDVEDTGLGIAPENLEMVTSEFFREKRPETRDIEGSGLGLAIVKRLVERAGGRLEVASTQGEGSTFSVLLPA
jgi:two-component system, OmpR family, phosphate regulon sensor histidine kinase PhoR